MKVVLLLADAAQVTDNSKAYALGLGWTNTYSPTPAIALLILIDSEPAEAPADLSIHIALLDSLEWVVSYPPGPDGQALPVVLTGTAQTAALDSPQKGEPSRLPLVVQVASGIVMEPGIYCFRATVSRKNGDAPVQSSAYFRVRAPGR